MHALKFYRWLLYATRARGVESFLASGPSFHDAFGAAVRHAKEYPPPGGGEVEVDLDGDLAFGTYRDAEALVLEGEQDMILTLMNPPLRRARFKVREEDATAALGRLGAAERAWFMDVAEQFQNRLG